MEGKLQTIEISKLINYFENPRHSIGSNEKDTLKKLFDAVGIQHMLNLAEDIQKNGLLGNQRIVVVYSEELNKYIVYEGNRRVAAIKFLLNPDKFDFLDKITIAKAKQITEGQMVINEIGCYVTNEQEALFIMERLHSGDDKGRGIRKWSPREIEVFKVRQNKGKKISYLIDYYVRTELNGLDITTIIPFTTIERIFNNREIRKIIGLDTEKEDTFTAKRMQTVVDASKWIVQESEKSGIAVTRLFNKARTIEDKLTPWLNTYMLEDCEKNSSVQVEVNKNSLVDLKAQDVEFVTNSIEDKNQANENADNHSVPVNITTVQENQNSVNMNGNNGRIQVNNGTGGSKNMPYFFDGLRYGHLSRNDVETHGVTAVCRELQLFSSKKMVSMYPLASAFLVRSIIEQSIKYYSKKHKIQGQDKYIWVEIKDIDKLSKIIAKYNRNLPNYIVDGEMRQYFTLLFGDYEKNIDPLNWVVHRPAEFRLDANTLIDLPQKGLLALVNYMLN